jgi:hypothetical protein
MVRFIPPGLCDRCGLRYPLHELRVEWVLDKQTRLKTCPSCHDESHPQLDTRKVETSDRQDVPDARPDRGQVTSRKLSGVNPVGGHNASTYITAKKRPDGTR